MIWIRIIITREDAKLLYQVWNVQIGCRNQTSIVRRNVTTMQNIYGMLRKNVLFIVIVMGLLFTYITRFVYLEDNVVSNSDCTVALSAYDGVLEQTWQPEAKWISGVSVSYCAQKDFVGDLQLKVFSDDYSQILVDDTLENCQFYAQESGMVYFDFDRTKVVPGERYHFQISVLNSHGGGDILVTAGTNYGGCIIDGADTGCGASIDITYAKYSKLFWLAAAFFPIFSFSFLYMCLTKRKFEETAALALLTEGLIIYVFGLFECLTMGLNVVYLLAILALIVSIILYNKRDLSFKDIISPGLLLYLVFLVIIIIVNHGEWLAKRDDMRHWGIAVRDMFYYNAYAKHIDSTVILARYLPFTALIEWAFVYMNGLFSEDILLIAYQVMMLSVVIIFTKPLQKGSVIKKMVPVLTAMVCVPLIFYNDISSYIMVDPLQMMLLAFVMICYYKDELRAFNIARILCALISLTLIKDIGLVLAAMAAFIMFADGIIKQVCEKKWQIKSLLFPVICVAAILIAYLGWQFYLSVPLKTQNVQEVENVEESETSDEAIVDNAATASGISISGILKVLRGEGEEYQYTVTTNYLTELFEGETYQFASIKLSFMDLLFTILFAIITLAYFGYWGSDKVRMYSFAGIAGIASFILCVFMQLTYWFTFPMYEALELTSFARYFGSYLCALIMTVLYLIYDKNVSGEKGREYVIYIIAFFLIISTPVNRLLVKNNDITWYATEEVIYGHDNIADILKSVAKRGEKVQFICQGSSGYSEYIFRNSVCPLISYHTYWNIVASEELAETQKKHTSIEGAYSSGNIVSPEVYESWLKEHEYLVLFHIDEEFIESYSSILKSDDYLENGSVYKIHSDENGITLELLGRTGIKEWS